MFVKRLKLTNWFNFRDVDVALRAHTFIIGANASGKSNLLDVFRFLRSVAQVDGGGLQRALRDRGGVGKVRSLHARANPEVVIDLQLSVEPDGPVVWRYLLAFRSVAKRTFVTREVVENASGVVLSRPLPADKKDRELLTQTHLEQVTNNARFRELAAFFSATTYLHLVPQLLKFGDEISGRIVENDPFGQGLLQRIARVTERSRSARLSRIQGALKAAVPALSELSFVKDEVSGLPHLEVRFEHWRGYGAKQREAQLSDGTLRLIGLLWALQEGEGLLLMEEPELSLHSAVIARIPALIESVAKGRKKGVRQVLVTTHSEALIREIPDGESVLVLEPGKDGTTVRGPDPSEVAELGHGLNVAEVLLPRTKPRDIDQLTLWP